VTTTIEALVIAFMHRGRSLISALTIGPRSKVGVPRDKTSKPGVQTGPSDGLSVVTLTGPGTVSFRSEGAGPGPRLLNLVTRLFSCAGNRGQRVQ